MRQVPAANPLGMKEKGGPGKSADPFDFLIEPIKKSKHKLVPLPGNPFPFSCVESAFDAAELHPKFSISSVFLCVGSCFSRIDFRVMEFGPDLSGEKKGSADADRTDGIKLIRIEQNFRLKALRSFIAAEAVGLNAMSNLLDNLLGKTVPDQNFSGQPRSFLAVTDFSAGAVFLLPTDVMKESSQFQDYEVRSLFPTDALAQFIDSLAMVPIVAAAGISEIPPGLSFDGLE